MASPASCSPETTTTAGGYLSACPKSNSSSLSPDGGVSTGICMPNGAVGVQVLPHNLHSSQQQERPFQLGEMSSPLCTTGSDGNAAVCSSNNWLQQENDYFKELAELLQENLNRPDMLQGVNSQALRDMIRQLQQLKDTKKENAIQHGDVSSSGPTLLASHIGPMLLEALDGFFFVMNTDGFVEFVSQNVQKYLKYSQADMVNKPIYTFLAAGDHDLFSRLLPDSMAWNLLSLSSPTSGRERRSHTFMCRFMAKPDGNNDRLQQGQYPTSQYENLQVSAISLPYPNSDIQREMDEFLSFAPISDSQPCLVCVARRVPDGNGNADNHYNMQRPNATAGNGGQMGKHGQCTNQTKAALEEGLQFSLICNPETLDILSVDCKDGGFKQLLTPKDASQYGHVGKLRQLCHPSDLPLLESHIRAVLERGSDSLSQLRMFIAPTMTGLEANAPPPSPKSPFSSLLFLQARSHLVARTDSDQRQQAASPNAVRLDFTLLRVTDAASSSSTAPLPSSLPSRSGQNCGISEPIKPSLLQPNDYTNSPSSSLFDSNVASFSMPQSANTDFGLSSYGDVDQSQHAAGNSNNFDLFLDMPFDCLQANGSSPSNSQKQHQLNSFSQEQSTPSLQFPSSTTCSPRGQQNRAQPNHSPYPNPAAGRPGGLHQRHSSGPRKSSASLAASRCPSALSEPVSSTACGAGGLQTAGPDDLQRLCSIFFDSSDLDNAAGQLSSSSSPGTHLHQPQQQTVFSPCQHDTANAELTSPGARHQQQARTVVKQEPQYGELNILKNLLAHEEHERRQQQGYQESEIPNDQQLNLQSVMAFRQQPNAATDANMAAFPGFSNVGVAFPQTADAASSPSVRGKGAKGGRKSAPKTSGGGRKSKKAQQAKPLMQLAAQQSPVLEQLLRPELGGADLADRYQSVGNQQQMQILQSLLQEEECGNGNPSQFVPNTGAMLTKAPAMNHSPAFAASSPTFVTTPVPTPNSRKRRGSSFVSSHNVDQPISSTTVSPPVSSGAVVSPGGRGQQTAAANSSNGPPPAKQSTSLLVQLLEQAAPQTRTLPTSIASSPLDKLAKENKENPNKPTVSTVLVETLLTRPRTSTPTTGGSQQHHQGTHAAPGVQSIGGPTFASPYVPTPPMFLQCQGGPVGQPEYGTTAMMYQSPSQQPYSQHAMQQQLPQSHGQMYEHQGMEHQQSQVQFMESRHFPPMDTVRPMMMPGTAPFPQQQHEPMQHPSGGRSGRQYHRQQGTGNVRHQLLLQQQKRGKQQTAPGQQQMAAGQFAPPQQTTPRPPPYPGLMAPTMRPAPPQANSYQHQQQQVMAYGPSMGHYSQALPTTSTVQHHPQSAQQQSQQHMFKFESGARFPVSAVPANAPASGHFPNSPLPPQMPNHAFYAARMPQPAVTPGNCGAQLTPSDVVRHELRQAVQNRAQIHQQQQSATTNSQFQHMHQARQAAIWQRSQSTPGTVDRRVSKDYGSASGQAMVLQGDCQQQQVASMCAPGTPSYSNVATGQTAIMQQCLSSPPSSSRSNSGAPPTDPAPTGNGDKMTYDGADQQNAFAAGNNGVQSRCASNLEASWNFDLGFENGLDMDDESTRNFLQQLLD